MRERVRANGSMLFALAVALVFAYALFEAQRMSVRARGFPLATAIPGLLVALFALWREWRAGARPNAGESTTLRALAWFAAWFAAVFIIGFSATTAVFIAVYLWVEAELPWWAAILAAGAGLAGVYIFANTLHVPLPEGIVVPMLRGNG